MTRSNSSIPSLISQPTASNSYCPAVPISVYRELVAEFQQTQAQVASLRLENQQLVKQNQQLHQEVEHLFRSAQKLQQLVTVERQTGSKMSVSPVIRQSQKRTKAPLLPLEKPISTAIGVQLQPRDEQQIIEISPFQGSGESSKNKEVNGWWLAIAILAIIGTALGAGFLLVRPLLNSN